MHSQKVLALVINVLGGCAVLGSYVLGLSSHSGQGALLWGEVPEAVRGAYTAMMFPAGAGYLTFTAYLLSLDPERVRVAGRWGYGLFLWLYLVFLVTAALWMPLCWHAVDNGLPGLEPVIQGVLAGTGLAALGLLVSLLKLDDPVRPRFHRAAWIGAVLLSVQCTVIDAMIWPRFFSVG